MARPVMFARTTRAVALGVAVAALATACAVDTRRLFVVLLAVAAYLGARMALRELLARHDRSLWVPVAQGIRAGKLDEQLLAATLPQLVHPVLRTSAAVALAHLKADREDWDGVRGCWGRMGVLSRAVIRSSLESTHGDQPGVALAARLMLARAWLARVGRTGSDLPAEVLFCAGAVLHGNGRYRRAFALGRRAWAASPNPVTAYNCACALARLGDLDQALDWLGTALDEGYPATDLEADEDLSALRLLPEFAAFAKRPSTPVD